MNFYEVRKKHLDAKLQPVKRKKNFDWYEGVDYAGYFDEGDSLVFRLPNGDYVAISTEFLSEKLDGKVPCNCYLCN